MPSASYRSSPRPLPLSRRGARMAVAGAAILPLLALTVATLDAAIVFAANGLLKTIGLVP